MCKGIISAMMSMNSIKAKYKHFSLYGFVTIRTVDVLCRYESFFTHANVLTSSSDTV